MRVMVMRGTALRYGLFYGAPGDDMGSLVRARKFPIIGDGAGATISVAATQLARAIYRNQKRFRKD